MKYLLIITLLFLAACQPAAPAEDQIQTAIAQTQAAQATPIPPTATIDPFELTKQANQTVNAAYQSTLEAEATNKALTPTTTPTWTPRPSATSRPTATPTPEFGTRINPYPLGGTVSLIQGGEIEFTLTIIETTRGEDAWDIILDANMFNDPAPEGLEYILIRVKVVYNGPDEGALELNDTDWASISKGRVYDYFDSSICCLEPEFDVTLFAGGEAEGLIALLVAIDDPAPLAAIGMKSDGSGGLFFALTP